VVCAHPARDIRRENAPSAVTAHSKVRQSEHPFIDSARFQVLARSVNLPSGLPFFEIARVLVRLDHVANIIVNANHGIM